MPITDLLSRISNPPPVSGPERTVRPLPSRAVLAIGGLSLTSLGLLAGLVVRPAAPDGAPAATAPSVAEWATAQATAPGGSARPWRATFASDPRPIPVDLLTALESASEAEPSVETIRLLDAVQFGFGSQSAQLAPELRTYVRRLALRIASLPVPVRITVTAPALDLATARAATLRHAFEAAGAPAAVDVVAQTGPHALSLASV